MYGSKKQSFYGKWLDSASGNNYRYYNNCYYFDYPVEIRKIIYTTNAIEGLNRQFRKVTKTKTVFPNDDSLRKMLYLAIQNLSSKWTQRCRNWDMIQNQLAIMEAVEA